MIGCNEDDEGTDTLQALATLSTSQNVIVEGNSVTFEIIFDNPNSTNGPLSIPFMVSGTATAGEDYGVFATIAQVANGATKVTVTIETTDDALVESDETIVITLNTRDLPTGITAGANISATVTIKDNDAFGATASVSATTTTVSEADSFVTFAINLSQANATGSAITFTYAVAGTAVGGSDYVVPSGTTSLASGASSVSVNITLLNDSDVENQ